MTELLFRKEVYEIVGAAIEVHNEMGAGFLEAVYQEAMEIELRSKRIPFHSQMPLDLQYKEQPLTKRYVVDFLCFDAIVIEIKALYALGGNEESQLINYLKATGLRLGVLINFGSPRLEWKRLIV